MSAYEALASSYDCLTEDVDYEGMLAFLETLLAHLGRRPETVVDLACGTGSLSLLLVGRGYTVTSVDASPEMLTEAYGKAVELEGNRPLFICQRMERLELPEAVDCVVCCLDSLNYVTDPADCRETFRRVYESLRPGGAFLFDINSAEKLRPRRPGVPGRDRRRLLCLAGGVRRGGAPVLLRDGPVPAGRRRVAPEL